MHVYGAALCCDSALQVLAIVLLDYRQGSVVTAWAGIKENISWLWVGQHNARCNLLCFGNEKTIMQNHSWGCSRRCDGHYMQRMLMGITQSVSCSPTIYEHPMVMHDMSGGFTYYFFLPEGPSDDSDSEIKDDSDDDDDSNDDDDNNDGMMITVMITVMVCLSNPCQNGSVCSPSGLDDFECECPNDVTGQHCELLYRGEKTTSGFALQHELAAFLASTKTLLGYIETFPVLSFSIYFCYNS